MSRPHAFLLFSAISAAALVCSPSGDADAQPAPRAIKEPSSSYLGIYSITPSRGTAKGGTRVQIAFSIPFARGPFTVFIGDRPATDVTTISTGAVWATTPTGTAGPAHVRVCMASLCATDNFTPMFEYLPLQPLTISPGGTGSGYVTGEGIDCALHGAAASVACAVSLEGASTITLSATPSAGSSFAGWSGACAGTDACVLTMDASRSVQAVFDGATDAVLVDVTKAGAGRGRVSGATVDCGTHCASLVPSSQVITLIAQADAGSIFSGWGGACTGLDACTIAPHANALITATFSEAHTQFLAEGATIAGFDVRLSVVNPTSTSGNGVLEFLRSDGVVVTQRLALPANAVQVVRPGQLPGLESAEFATVLTADVPAVLERTMTWNGASDGHAGVAAASLAAAWHFAEGTTHAGFNTYYLIANPNATATTGSIEFLLPAGRAAPTPLRFSVAPHSRQTIWLNGVAGLDDTDVAGIVRVDDGAPPIAVERAVYKDAAGRPMVAGHVSLGSVLGRDWTTVLTEGATGPYFDTFVLIANPHALALPFRASFQRADGVYFEQEYTIEPRSRMTLWLDQEEIPRGSGLHPLADTAVTTYVNTMSGLSMNEPYALAVERAMWWPGSDWAAGHASAALWPGGVNRTAVALAEGEVGGAQHAETYLLIAQFSGETIRADITAFFDDGSQATENVVLGNGRTTLNVGVDILPAARDRHFGVLVRSLPGDGVPAQPIIVERSTYWSADGLTWTAGTSVVGAYVP